eukprot:CAMPEP_0171789864 /NCGR_PEP_ID=MMETSP0991-20121206/65382_1 /TAXON_ID=483369 /ORGANISM="non described non described, Strain CCMP2098" /LENGTH=61 /DNA_ID=CAMNT_0012399353 /DNA_START=59 /DNA_END=241 /DNA_ORIENTATION=+
MAFKLRPAPVKSPASTSNPGQNPCRASNTGLVTKPDLSSTSAYQSPTLEKASALVAAALNM